jgi:transitional endoplasmic reticulum ATPase
MSTDTKKPGEVMESQQKDLSTAILRQKSSPNKLLVDEAPQDDNSLIFLAEATLERLNIFRSDTVLLKGKRRRETIAIALTFAECEEGKILMNKGNSTHYGAISRAE